MLLWVGLGVLGAAGAALAVPVVRWRRLRDRATIAEVGRWTATLLRQSAQGSVLIAVANGRPGFLQYALTGRDGDWRRLEFGLPEADWSKEALPAVERVLDRFAVPWTVETNPGNLPVPRFLRAEIEGPREEVLERASALFVELAAALGYDETQTYAVSLQGGDAPEYEAELLARIESLPRQGRVTRGMAALLRRQLGASRQKER